MNEMQETVHGILRLGHDLASNKPPHEHRHQRHGQQGRRRHGESAGKGQWTEQAPFLSLQREDRHIGNRDNQQGEEQGRPHLLGGRRHGLPALRDRQGLAFFIRRAFQVLVGILDEHDGPVHHGADGDGDPAQGHDIGIDPHPAHGEKGDEDADGQGNDRHQGGARVEQEQHANQAHHDELLKQFLLEVVYRALDEIAPVVHSHDLDALGQPLFQFLQLGAHPLDGRQGVLAKAHDDHAAGHFALAIEVHQPTAQFRPQLDIGHVAQAYGRAVRVDAHRNIVDIVY